MPDHPVWFSLAAAVLPGRAGRSTCARRHIDRRSRRVRAARAVPAAGRGAVHCLLGVGESSDAYHMSAPHPEGDGARRAMQRRLVGRGPRASDDRLHQPARHRHAEQRSPRKPRRHRPVRAATPCSSTKGATGHALGAAGALEAVICALALQNGFMPGGAQHGVIDPTLTAHYITENRRAPLRGSSAIPSASAATNCA